MNIQEPPSWIRRHLNPADLRTIAESVARVEDHTTGEVVPVIVRRSTPWKTDPILLFLILLPLLVAMWTPITANARSISPLLGHFSEFGLILVFLLLAIGLSRIPAIASFVSRFHDEQDYPWMRARQAFFEKKLHTTSARTGIMIFISFVEHRVIVLADEGISAKLPQDTWQQIVDQLVTQIRQKKLAVGLTEAIQNCGHLLAEHFPSTPGNRNELPDQLIIKD